MSALAAGRVPALFGDRLVAAGLATPLQIDEALRSQRTVRGSVGYHLLRLGRITPAALSEFLETEMTAGLLMSPRAGGADLEALPARLAHLYNAYPVASASNKLVLALPPIHGDAVRAIGEATGRIIEPTVLPARWLREAVERDYLGASRPAISQPLAGLTSFLVDDGEQVRPLAPDLRTPTLSPEMWLRSVLGEAISTRRRVVDIATAGSAAPRWMSAADAERLVSFVEELGRMPPRTAARSIGRFQVSVRGRRPVVTVERDGWKAPRLRLVLADARFATEDVDEIFAGQDALQDAVEALAVERKGLILIAGPSGGGARQLCELLGARLAESLAGSIRIAESQGAASAFAQTRRAIGDTGTAAALHEAIEDEPGFVACEELPGPRSVERALLLASRRPVLAGLTCTDAVATLAWLQRQGLGGAVKAGLLRGVIATLALDPACSSCAHPVTLDRAIAMRWAIEDLPTELLASEGCAACAGTAMRKTMPLLTWTPLAGRPESDLLVDDERSGRARERAAGRPTLLDLVIDRCTPGSGERGDLRSAELLLRTSP